MPAPALLITNGAFDIDQYQQYESNDTIDWQIAFDLLKKDSLTVHLTSEQVPNNNYNELVDAIQLCVKEDISDKDIKLLVAFNTLCLTRVWWRRCHRALIHNPNPEIVEELDTITFSNFSNELIITSSSEAVEQFNGKPFKQVLQNFFSTVKMPDRSKGTELNFL